MRVGIVKNSIPFGPATLVPVVEGLQKELAAAGNRISTIELPWLDGAGRLGRASLLISRLYRLENVEAVIALEAPSCFIKHPNKILWLCSPLPDLPELLPEAKRCLFQEFRALFAGNKHLAGQIKKYCGLRASVRPRPSFIRMMKEEPQ